ncbi:MAG: 1-acyl-sn-glycerol-3-phosphate acyltransferase [Solirubrobacteraceae bacterium]
MEYDRYYRRAREKQASFLIYGIVRITFQIFFHVYFRFQRIGREHIPRLGPVIIASNHRSFLDPFVIACMARRPMYYVAKKEIFLYNRVLAWLLASLGAFPVARGTGDADFIDTAKAILARGDIVLIFPEGTRTRPGSLGRPKRGVGRLALETGAPVVPVAVIGTEAVRRGWRIRPHKVRIRAGRALHFPQVDHPSVELAGAVTNRIWPCVMLQWEWLGGLPPVRRVAIVGAGVWGTTLAVCLARAGVEVELGCRTQQQALALDGARENQRYLPRVPLPESVRVMSAADLSLEGHDIVCLAVPANALPAVMATHGGRVTSRAGVLVVSKGVVPPLGTLPSAFVAERCKARAVAALAGPANATEMLQRDASVVVACLDRGFARQLADVLGADKLDVLVTTDVTGAELAGAAKNVAALAAAAAATQRGASVAGTAAGKVFAELDALARARGAHPETFAGVAGASALVGGVVDTGSLNHRAGELLAQGVPAAEIGDALGAGTEAVESVALLAGAAREAQVDTPALDGLAALVEGRIDPHQWAAGVTDPAPSERSRPVGAA